MTTTETAVETPVWTIVPAATVGYIVKMFCQPDMSDPDRFIVTMDGPRGGEYGRMTVTRQNLLRMIVEADAERERVTTARREDA